MKTYSKIDIKYYGKDGNVHTRCTVPVTENALVHFELMQSHYCKLSFKLAKAIYFKLGDFIETAYGRFELTDNVKPKDDGVIGYSYELQLDAYYRKWKNKQLKYMPNSGSPEGTFSLTSNISTHANIIIDNLKFLATLSRSYLYDQRYIGSGTDFTFVVDASVDAVKAKSITYSNSSILDAIANIAQTFECEWWLEGNIIHFGTCENTNNPVDFKDGENIVSMSSSQSQASYANRVYAFGAARNLPSGYKQNSSADITKNGVVEKRLMLPTLSECSEKNKQLLEENGFELNDGYIQVKGLLEDEYVEGVTTNDDIYPRNLIKTSDVSSYEKEVEDESTTKEGDYIKRTFYKVSGLSIIGDDGEKTGDMAFRNSYILSGKTLHIVFQSGSLNGMDFECEFNPDAKSEILRDDDGEPILKDGKEQINPESQVFEVVGNEDYGRFLPDSDLHPKAGDTFVLYNWDATKLGDALVKSSSNELLTDAIKNLKKSMIDPTTYTCTADSNYSYGDGNGVFHTEGDRVNLYNKGYAESFRESRIIGYELHLDVPCDSAKYIVGEKPAYSRLNAMSSQIEELVFNGQSYVNGGGGGNGIYIIKSYDSVRPTEYNVYSAKAVNEQRLSKLKNDTAQGAITFVKGLVAQALSIFEKGLTAKERSDFAKGLTAGELSTFEQGLVAKALSTFTKGLTAEELSTLHELHVKADARFDGQLSSPDFASGFLDGRGWRIKNTPVTNAAGMQENRYTEEIDNLIVRGSMRVYEMIISQLLGENDNRIFTAMMEVDHYDDATGKVYLDTQGGKMYNPFRRDDCIMVQQYNGMPSEDNDHYVTKQYELVVTEVGSEGTGEAMLAWVKFENFTSTMDGATALQLIKRKDTFVRVDNLTNPDRKGIIQMMTVGTDTPYMDIIHGMKTDPDNALKGRMGNLQGIVHPIFGALSGFGELLQNLFATGDLILRRTGDNLDTKLMMLQEQFATRFAQTSYELTEEDNYLHNGQFLTVIGSTDDNLIIDGWTVDSTDDSLFWVDAMGMPVMVNSMVTAGGNRRVTIENNEGRNMLRLKNAGISQALALIRQPGTHKEYDEPTGTADSDTQLKATGESYKEVQDKLYLSLRIYANTAGTLTIGFKDGKVVDGKENELQARNVGIAYSGEWQTVEMEGKWNGTGNFVLQYSGDAYVSMLTLTDRPLDSLSKTVSTQILQTAKNIQLLGENIDKVNGRTTKLGIDLDAEKEAIRLYVDEQNERLNEELSSEINIQAGRIDLLNTWRSETSTKIAGITSDIDSIRATVGEAATKEELKKAQSTLESTISSNYESLSTDIGRAWNHADSVGSDIRYDYGSTITLVNQKADSWTAAAGRFDTNGHLRDTSYLTTTADMNALMSEHFNADGSLKNMSGLVTSSNFSGLVSRVEETESGLKDANGNIDKAAERITKAEASISTSVQKDKDGYVSNAKIKADRIILEGAVTANNYFKILTDGSIEAKSGVIGGLSINGNALTNEGMNNDAYIVMRNDTNKIFAGIGGNVLPASTGSRAVARFENNNTAGYFGETNYSTIIGASGALTNVALDITGGYVSGLRLRGKFYGSGGTSSSPTEIEKGVNVVELNGSGYYRLPVMRKEDDGYIIFVKRTYGGDSDSSVKLKANTCIDSDGNYRTGFFLYDRGSAASEITFGSCGDAMILVYQRGQTNSALSSSSYKGAWIQFKCPRDW